MEDSRSLRRELDRRVAELSDDQVREVLGFTEALRRRNRRPAEEPPAPPASDHDPLLDLVGSIDEAPFAHDIDEELCGGQPVPDTALEDVRKRLAKVKGSMSKTIRSMRDERG